MKQKNNHQTEFTRNMSAAARKVKVGVVGVGVLGRHHARLYKASENAELVGIYDVSDECARRVSEEFGLKVFPTPEALAEECEALSIAVPATKHHEIGMPLLRMNKHMLMEKPLCVTVEEGTDMVREARERGLVLGVGHVERFNPAMDYLEKRQSKTRFIEAHRLSQYPPARPGQHRRGTEVSVVLDLMIHDLDLILTMINSEIERIDAIGIPILSKTEDLVSVRIKFVNGSAANITASRVSTEPMRRFRVFQDDAYISMDYGNHSGMVFKKNRVGLAQKAISLNEKNALADELEDFLAAVRQTIDTGTLVEPKVSGEQGLRALKLAVDITSQIHEYNDKYGFQFV
jgi:predicted dehydrogenase